MGFTGQPVLAGASLTNTHITQTYCSENIGNALIHKYLMPSQRSSPGGRRGGGGPERRLTASGTEEARLSPGARRPLPPPGCAAGQAQPSSPFPPSAEQVVSLPGAAARGWPSLGPGECLPRGGCSQDGFQAWLVSHSALRAL